MSCRCAAYGTCKRWLWRYSRAFTHTWGNSSLKAVVARYCSGNEISVESLLDSTKEKQEELTKIEKVKIAGPVYIPSILIGAGTVACIFGANVLNKRHQAALVSAYTLAESSFIVV